ncbi:MAG: methyl-accepting chemotaxis protein [Desulfuromonadaceae bacterium]|nr:methyl-accepting chemotaxis protein [Desulfuromonadaceae bacterium]
MTLQSPIQQFSTETDTGAETLLLWRDLLSPAIETLQGMAGTTEDEFLQIGSEVQGFYQRSSDITRMSNQLVELVSGETVQSLTGRLQQMMSGMESYLNEARTRSGDSCGTLVQVQELLDKLSEPLEGFQKMNKALRMLSISTKIESARLGEMGSGFVNLAMDVEKLSHQVNDKSAAILAHRQMLSNMINSNLSAVRSTGNAQDAKVASSLKNTASSLQELVSVNDRCTQFGATVSAISAGVTNDISEVVSSLQMHDMTRQQVEHIVEALQRLLSDLSASGAAAVDENRRHALIVESGDVCELQEAQLRFASSELYTAVRIIVDSLRDVAHKQSVMAAETRNVAGVADSSGTSFVDVMSHGMTDITAALTSCASADREMSDTMKKVAQTIGEIAAFVTDIEEIGSEIDLIAMNAQVKAAHTGPEGAALGVLAEAIKRLSFETVRQTDSVAETLKNITIVTEHLSIDTETEEENLGERISYMQEEAAEILRALASMNSELFSILSALSDRVASLTDDVGRATSGIDVHERTKVMSDRVLASLEEIVNQSRRIVPASSEFKENLRHMEQRYTMESERHIHEAIARKRSGQSAVVAQSVVKADSSDDSEFGDNVDLF